MPITSPSPIRHILEANQLRLTEGQWFLLEQWVPLLLETNQKLNLISRKDTDRIWENHILHSLALLVIKPFPKGSKVCDVGTGGGFPGIPLAIACPHSHFTLMDATGKKIKALQRMITSLALPNTQVVRGRAEEVGKQPLYQHRFSIVTARAVASLQSLEQWTRDLRAPHAVLHAYKGGDLRDEIQALSAIKSIKKVEPTLIALDQAPQFSHNQKQIVSLYF